MTAAPIKATTLVWDIYGNLIRSPGGSKNQDPPSLARFARRRTPLGIVRLFLEVRAGHELLREVGRIVDHGRHDEPLARLRMGDLGVVLGDLRVLTVRHTVAPQPSGKEVARRHFERAPSRWRRTGTALEECVERAAA